jgi:acyl carrier protein
MDSILDELQGVFRRVFDDDALVIADSTTSTDVDGWDSMAHINLIVAVEKHFGVKFTAAEIGAMRGADQNVGKLAQLLSAKTGRVEGSNA